ncbi:hypothetical protein ASD39_22120 [Sphingomonas sp. Root50]|nr:hypothetical protein ASD17_18220 [Sphingomonas sp. Root1294]KQY70591.1 hypothetical protein ASD39_22120 [Sphingomonas sp. Root50]KRB91919.1 hypothetical protein ASE22_08190 [Sphingomonas sp. Root720]
MVATEPVLVELDNAACMKLAGRCTTLNHQSIVEDHYGEIVEVVERLYDEHAFDAQGSHEVPHILVTALDLG